MVNEVKRDELSISQLDAIRDNELEQRRNQALTERAGKASKMIWVTFRKEGMHKYPAALEDPKLKITKLAMKDEIVRVTEELGKLTKIK